MSQHVDLWMPTRYIRWSAQGDALFISGPTKWPKAMLVMSEHEVVPMPEPSVPADGLARLDLRSGKVDWLNVYLPGFILLPGSEYRGRYATVRDGVWTWVKAPLPDTDLVFGQGLFSKTAVKRYDVQRGKLSTIRTLESVLYRK